MRNKMTKRKSIFALIAIFSVNLAYMADLVVIPAADSIYSAFPNAPISVHFKRAAADHNFFCYSGTVFHEEIQQKTYHHFGICCVCRGCKQLCTCIECVFYCLYARDRRSLQRHIDVHGDGVDRRDVPG